MLIGISARQSLAFCMAEASKAVIDNPRSATGGSPALHAHITHVREYRDRQALITNNGHAAKSLIRQGGNEEE